MSGANHLIAYAPMLRTVHRPAATSINAQLVLRPREMSDSSVGHKARSAAILTTQPCTSVSDLEYLIIDSMVSQDSLTREN